VLADWFQPYLGLEEAASVVRTYEIQFVPGLLQTADYARAVVARGNMGAPADQIEAGARDEPRNDAAGARFAHRVRRDDDIGKLFGLHKNPERLRRLSRGEQAIEVARTDGR